MLFFSFYDYTISVFLEFSIISIIFISLIVSILLGIITLTQRPERIAKIFGIMGIVLSGIFLITLGIFIIIIFISVLIDEIFFSYTY